MSHRVVSASWRGSDSWAHTLLRCIAWMAGACAVLAALSLLGGVHADEAFRLALVLLAQAVLGMGLWVSVRRGIVTPPELIGASLVLGPVVFTFAMLATLALPSSPSSLGTTVIVSLLGCLGLLLLVRSIRRGFVLRRVGRQQGWIMVVIVPLTFILSRALWLQTPLPRSIVGWASLGGDAAVEEARAKSIVLLGLHDYLLAQGHPLKYHLFAQAWSGFTDLSSLAGTYVVTTRMVPLVTVAAVLLLTWTWVTMLSARYSAGWAAVALLGVGGLGEVGTAVYVGSMSQSWGAALVSLFALVLLLSIRGEVTRRPLILCVVAGSMVLAKVNTIILLVAAFGSSLTVPGGWRPRLRAVFALALALLVALVVVLAFEYGYGNGLYGSLTQTADYLRTTIPVGVPFATFLGALLAALVLLTPWSAVVVVAWSKAPERRQVLAFAAALAGTAVLIAAFTGQWGQSQMYFPMTAGVVLVPLSAWGCVEATALLVPTSRRGGLAAAGVTVALASVWLVVGPKSLVLRMLVVIALAIAAVLVVVMSSRSVEGLLARRVTGSFTLFLTASVFLAALITWLAASPPRWQTEKFTRESPNAISELQIDAIGWLQAENPNHELVASNWLCSDPAQVPPDCLDIQFPLAAVGGQRMLIEGFSYAAGPQPPAWARERLALVQDFSTQPSAETAQRLYEQGVRWLFIDRRRTPVVTWEPFAHTAFANADAFVLQLSEPWSAS